MVITADRVILKSPHEVRGKEISEYYYRNREFAKEYEPVRSDIYYTEEYQNELLKSLEDDWEKQKGYCFFIYLSDKVIVFAFEELKLHRIEGNVMPSNKDSRAVLEKCDFINEGTSSKYLKINGVWEDHIHYVLLNDSIE